MTAQRGRWGIGFLLLFPAYFAYHWAALGNSLPLFAGGFVNEMSAFILLCVLVDTAWHRLAGLRLRPQVNDVDLTFALFIAHFVLVVAVHTVAGTAPAVAHQHVATIVQLCAAYWVLRTFPYDDAGAGRLLKICFLVLSSLVLVSAYDDALSLLLASSDQAKAATYQGLARAYLLVAVLAVATIQRRTLRWLLATVSVFVLFLIGARSEVLAALISFVSFEVALSRGPIALMAAWIGALAAGVAIMIANLDALQSYFPDNRLLYLLSVGLDDGSVSERLEYQALAWRVLQEFPIFGDYAHYAASGGPGAYAHNITSVWVDLGLFGLATYVAVIVAALAACLRPRPRLARQDPRLRRRQALCVAFLLQTVFFVAAAKSLNDICIATLAGVAGAYAGAGLRQSSHRRPGSLLATEPPWR